jgi:hypothetical protein
MLFRRGLNGVQAGQRNSRLQMAATNLVKDSVYPSLDAGVLA